MSEAEFIRARSASTEAGASRDLSYAPLPEPLTVGVYDNHTHLEISDGDPSGASGTGPLGYRDSLDRASSVGVRGVVQVGGDLETSRWSAAIAAVEPRVLAAVAIHPNEAPRYAAAGELDAALAEIDDLAAQPRVRAIGETGLDFFRTQGEGLAAQHESFEAHIAIAKKHELALQIHDRDAHQAVIETLLLVGAPAKTVFHCFSGDAAMAKVCADNGWYVSVAGTSTFKNAGELREAIAVVPRQFLLIETDAPYLTPMPYRGRPNAPYMIPYTLRALASSLGAEVSLLAAQIATNTEDVYGHWDDEPVTLPSMYPDESL